MIEMVAIPNPSLGQRRRHNYGYRDKAIDRAKACKGNVFAERDRPGVGPVKKQDAGQPKAEPVPPLLAN